MWSRLGITFTIGICGSGGALGAGAGSLNVKGVIPDVVAVGCAGFCAAWLAVVDRVLLGSAGGNFMWPWLSLGTPSRLSTVTPSG